MPNAPADRFWNAGLIGTVSLKRYPAGPPLMSTEIPSARSSTISQVRVTESTAAVRVME